MIISGRRPSMLFDMFNREYSTGCGLIFGVQIRRTQRAIKHALTERWYAWQEARKEAVQDPEVNLEANTSMGELAYSPKVLEVSINNQLPNI